MCACVCLCVWLVRDGETRGEKVEKRYTHESVEGGGGRERARVWMCVFVCVCVVGKRWRDREGATVTEKV